jgi:hypothetical protein
MIFDPNLPGWAYVLMLALLIPALFFPIYGFILICVVILLALFIVLETEFDIIDKLKKLLKK